MGARSSRRRAGRVTPPGNLPINGRVARIPAQSPRAGRTPPRRSVALRLLLACGMAAPVLALASTLLAVAAYPHFNHARQYLSELGGATAARPAIFNAGVFAAGFLAALAGVGFGLAIAVLTRARIAGGLTAAVFLLAGYGLAQAAIFPWPDPRHLAINLGLGIQIAPLLLLWGLWPRRDLRGLKLFLAAVFVAMAVPDRPDQAPGPPQPGERFQCRMVGARLRDHPGRMGRRGGFCARPLPAAAGRC